MGRRDDDKAITPYARSWAQHMAALRRPQYNVYKDTFRDAKRYKVERVHPDGSRTAIGDHPTKKGAVNIARLLAGHSGDVTYVSDHFRLH